MGETPVKELFSRSDPDIIFPARKLAYFKIDLGKGRLFCPTTYTLKHGYRYGSGLLRNWELQASIDNLNWVVLRKHENDRSLYDAYGVASWALSESSGTFRYFRIVLTGMTSDNVYRLSCGGFELYGTLFNVDPLAVSMAGLTVPQQWSTARRTLDQTDDMHMVNL